MWQINCGSGIAEIREKNQVQLTMVLKTEPDIKPFFFFNFQFNPSFARFLTGCWPVFRVLTGSDWLSVPGWTGRSGPVFKTLQLTRCKLKYNILILKWCKQKQKKSTKNTSIIFLFWSVVNKSKKKRYSEHKYNILILILKCCEQKQKEVHSKQIRID